MNIRLALPQEMDQVGALRVEAYQAQDLLNPSYASILRDLGRDGHGTVFVADDDGKLAGTVMLEPWHPGSEVAAGPHEAEVRALAVAPWAQRRGAARALMCSVIDAAAAAGAARLLLSTQPAMTSAQHLYASLGFARLPELDWSPVPRMTLLAFGIALPLSPAAGAAR